MITSKFLSLTLLLAGGAAAAFIIGRHSRYLEKRQHKENVRTWEEEGGNLAPSVAPAVPRSEATP